MSGVSARRSMAGVAMIEVLVAMLIVAFGALGYAGLQARTAVTNLEGHQRSQALLLLNDITHRINLNRVNATSYVGGDIGATDPGTCPSATGTARDLCEWAQLIQGSAEQRNGSKLGAVIGARGCIENLGSGQYRISLVWQGIQASGPTPLSCGVNQYSSENLRRGVSVVVRIGTLA
jgi:type IV pilus assembly protein PilV